MLISVDESDPRPLYQQIAAQVKDQVRRGDLRPGDELPSVRDLARNLGVNLHTVRGAYLKLREQGVIDMRLGRRARIARKRPSPASVAEAEAALSRQVQELVADAYLLGLSSDSLHKLLDRHSKQVDAAMNGHGVSPEDNR